MYALIITDDADDAALISMAFQRAGLAVTTSRSLEDSMQSWIERPSDLVCLSLCQPPPDEQVRRVRQETLAPLIVIINSPNEGLQIELLNLGADLVLSHPYSAKLLIAQAGVMLRRAGNVPMFSLPGLAVGSLTLDPGDRTIDVPGKEKQRLTHLEFRLLYTLMMNRGQVVPTETIVEQVWGYTDQGDRDLVRGLISRLRVKVEADPRKPQNIITVPGLGYTFKADD